MNCNDIGAKVSKQDFLDFLNSVQGGQFFHIKGYVNSVGEVSDHILRFGVNYNRIKQRDINFLNEVVDGKRSFKIQVEHGVWIPNELLSFDKMFTCEGEHDSWVKAIYDFQQDGRNLRVNITGVMSLLDVEKFSSRKAANKTQVTLSYELDSDHPLVRSAIGEEDLFGTLLGGLNKASGRSNPTDHTAKYVKEAKSCYSSEKDGVTTWYLRDVLEISKTIKIYSENKFSASTPLSAVKEAIRNQFLITGNYRQFVLSDGKFQSITIDRQSILMDNDFYFALPKDAKAAFVNTLKE
ncbi:MAG: hypothetical protein WCS56_00245 [Bacilli bacterium]